jgi:radical SAM protein with 4Fe4S-binding SPASM domain
MKPIWSAENKPRWIKRRLNQVSLMLALHMHLQRVPALPRILMIEPTNLCNLRCPLCPTGNGSLKRPRGMLDFGLFQRILAELDGALERLMLYNYGEPFLHPQIYAMIALARQAEIHTRLSTNGFVFSQPGFADQLIASKLNHLRVSLDGASPESYQVYRVGGSFETILEGVRELEERKQQLGRDRPVVELQFIVMHHNEHELPAIRSLAQTLNVSLRLKTVGLGDLTKRPELSRWLPEQESLRRYSRQQAGYMHTNGNNWLCDQPWERLVINWDGEIVPCCYDRDGVIILGNAQDGVGRAWNSTEMQHLRAAQRPGKLPELCRRCSARLWNKVIIT